MSYKNYWKVMTASKLNGKVEKLSLEYIWQGKINTIIKYFEIIKKKFNDIKEQYIFSNVIEKNVLYFVVK